VTMASPAVIAACATPRRPNGDLGRWIGCGPRGSLSGRQAASP
jgi:hypothetical protein